MFFQAPYICCNIDGGELLQWTLASESCQNQIFWKTLKAFQLFVYRSASFTTQHGCFAFGREAVDSFFYNIDWVSLFACFCCIECNGLTSITLHAVTPPCVFSTKLAHFMYMLLLSSVHGLIPVAASSGGYHNLNFPMWRCCDRIHEINISVERPQSC